MGKRWPEDTTRKGGSNSTINNNSSICTFNIVEDFVELTLIYNLLAISSTYFLGCYIYLDGEEQSETINSYNK